MLIGGGCLYPIAGKRASGKDCSAIYGADTVSCQQGKCYVESCKPGLTVSDDHESCK